MGLSIKALQQKNEINKLKAEKAGPTKNKTAKAPPGRSASPTKKSISHKDPFEAELQEEEKELIEQIIQMVTYTELLTGLKLFLENSNPSKQESSTNFYQQVDLKLVLVNKKTSKLENMRKYIAWISDLYEKKKDYNPENQANYQYTAKGAYEMHQVLTGNIFNELNIF